MKRAAGWLFINLAVALVLLAAVEALFFFLIRHPFWLSRCPGPVRSAAHLLYMESDAAVIQFLPECARHDPGLGYTLKPGTCPFSNREFAIEVRANSLGARGPEQSLAGPEIIVAGDSVAMGWGVREEDTFASRLEKATGKKVLNASISSFGTAREMLLLRKANTSRMKFCVIQYADNDYEENLAYFQNDNVLSVMGPDAYGKLVKDQALARKYYFGKYVLESFPKILAGIWRARSAGHRPDPADAARKFINCLWSCRMALQNARVIVFELNGYPYFSPFIKALEKEKAQPDQPDFIRDMTVVDLSGILQKRHFFALDGHPDAQGHALVARDLARVIRGLEHSGKAG